MFRDADESKNTFCDLYRYILQFGQPLVSSLTGGRRGKPTYKRTFHPISGTLSLNSPVNSPCHLIHLFFRLHISPVNLSFTFKNPCLHKREVVRLSVFNAQIEYADQRLIICIFEFSFVSQRVQILWGRPLEMSLATVFAT